MTNICKRIVLLKGLYPIKEDDFRLTKSLLASDLKLTRKMQEEYDRIKLADLMEERFPSDAGLGKLITLFREIPGLASTADFLKQEKAKAQAKCKGKGKIAGKRNKQGKSSTVQPTPTADEALKPESPTDATASKNEQKTDGPRPLKRKRKGSSSKKTQDLGRNPEDQKTALPPETAAASASPQTPQQPPPASSSSTLTKKSRLKCIPSEPSEEDGHQTGTKEVMVLKVTEPFTYAVKETEQKLIHATVATEDEFFRVKVFDTKFKDKFTPRNVIAISNYVGRDGFLEIYKYSTVSNVSADRKMNISSTLIQHAKATPKIRQLCSQSKGKHVNGIFKVFKKTVREGCIFYEIKDNTGTMQVLVYGRLANISCEEGDKLNLTCFELVPSVDTWQLRSVLHSHLKVIKCRKTKQLNSDSNEEVSLEF